MKTNRGFKIIHEETRELYEDQARFTVLNDGRWVDCTSQGISPDPPDGLIRCDEVGVDDCHGVTIYEGDPIWDADGTEYVATMRGYRPRGSHSNFVAWGFFYRTTPMSLTPPKPVLTWRDVAPTALFRFSGKDVIYGRGFLKKRGDFYIEVGSVCMEIGRDKEPIMFVDPVDVP